MCVVCVCVCVCVCVRGETASHLTTKHYLFSHERTVGSVIKLLLGLAIGNSNVANIHKPLA